MRLKAVFVGSTILLAGACGGLTGCDSGPVGTDAEIKKPESLDEIKAKQDKLKEGMKTGGGMYKGAPGQPSPAK
jgi:hypothetical protein